MARKPLEIGQSGKITTTHLPNKATGAQWRAYCSFRDLDGRTRQVERWGETERKAKRNLTEALKQREAPPSQTRLTKASRFRDAAEMWLRGVEQRRTPRTIQSYRWALRSRVLPDLGDLRLAELRQARLNAYMDELAARGYSANTRRNIKTVVSGVLREAVAHEAIPANPAKEMRRIEGGHRKVRALSPEERATFLARLDDLRCKRHISAESAVAEGCQMCSRHRRNLPDLVRFMLGTGVRIGECLAVRWCDLDLSASPPLARVGPTLVRAPGKGLIRQEGGKTKAATRTVVVPAYLGTLLAVRRPPDAPDDAPVFPSASHTWWDPANAQDALRAARERTGFEWITSHVFRKTAATILDDAGFSARQIADQLGHERPSLTQDTYLGRSTLNPAAATALDEAYRAGR